MQPVSVSAVNLLGVCVRVEGTLDPAEHRRRQGAGLSAVTDSELLGRLLEVPVGQPVADPVFWAETAGQPAGIVVRGDDGYTVTRRLRTALVIDRVIVAALRGGENRAIQQASLFAGFTARWVQAAAEPRAAVVLEAKLCGVGLLDAAGSVVLAGEPPDAHADGWAWLLQEKAYGRWLTEWAPQRAPGSRAQATASARTR
jgi:hypothetical protein